VFVAYTDCSVKGGTAFLAFIIIFEDKSKIKRRIVVNQSDSNISEAMAISEFLSFLSYYNIRDGLLLIDSNGVKKQLRKKSRKLHKHIPKDTYKALRSLNVRTQVIPRKFNLAHRVCYENKYFTPHPISLINRSYYQKIENYPEYFMQLSVLEEYRQLFNKQYASFHEAQMNLNKKIWLADLVQEIGNMKVYEIHDRRIKVYRDTIVKLTRSEIVNELVTIGE
jgi:ribonuclease HI